MERVGAAERIAHRNAEGIEAVAIRFKGAAADGGGRGAEAPDAVAISRRGKHAAAESDENLETRLGRAAEDGEVGAGGWRCGESEAGNLAIDAQFSAAGIALALAVTDIGDGGDDVVGAVRQGLVSGNLQSPDVAAQLQSRRGAIGELLAAHLHAEGLAGQHGGGAADLRSAVVGDLGIHRWGGEQQVVVDDGDNGGAAGTEHSSIGGIGQ